MDGSMGRTGFQWLIKSMAIIEGEEGERSKLESLQQHVIAVLPQG
jgi:hypothetical protein